MTTRSAGLASGRTGLRWLAACAMAVAVAAGLSLTGVTAAQAQGTVQICMVTDTAACINSGAHNTIASTGVGIIDNFGHPGYKCLSDHCHTSNIDIESSGCGLWLWVNQQRWTDPLTKKNVTVVELQDTRYGLCINLDSNNDFYYLDSCVHGDKNELFWVHGLLEVNVQATDSGFCDPYYADMTTSAVTSGDDVYVGCAATTNAEDAWEYQ